MGQTEVQNEAVYAIKYGDELRVKRLSKRFDGGLFIRSDNAKYPEESVAPADVKSIEVLGRMLWRGGGVN